jgi:hypothetical protein
VAKKTPIVGEEAVQQGADSNLPVVRRRPSSLMDTRVINCGGNLELLKNLARLTSFEEG